MLQTMPTRGVWGRKHHGCSAQLERRRTDDGPEDTHDIMTCRREETKGSIPAPGVIMYILAGSLSIAPSRDIDSADHRLRGIFSFVVHVY